LLRNLFGILPLLRSSLTMTIFLAGTALITCQETPDEEQHDDGGTCSGTLDVDGKEIKGKIVFERDANDNPFFSEQQLIDYLAKKYSVTYLRDMSKPAAETGG
jgi:hypothetical protein